MRRASKSYRREPTRAEMVRWRKLAKAADALAEHPMGAAGDFLKARNATRGKVMPPSLYVRGSSLHQLCKLADDWSDLGAADRVARAAALSASARAVIAALDHLEALAVAGRPSAPARAKRFRKDIDG